MAEGVAKTVVEEFVERNLMTQTWLRTLSDSVTPIRNADRSNGLAHSHL